MWLFYSDLPAHIPLGTAPAYTNGMRTMRKGEFHGDSRETRMMGGLTLADAEYRTLVTNYGGELAD